MKKLLNLFSPLPIAMLSLLIVSGFLRFYLHINSDQLVREFKNQNFRELYSLDSLKVSSRLNSLSTVINWVCIEGTIAGKSFYKMERGNCNTSAFQEKKILHIPEANNTVISFTIRLPREVELLFTLFFVMQIILIAALVVSTKKSEEEKRTVEIKINKLARQMSHDIRSPLSTLNTIISGLEKLSPEEMTLLEKSISRINDIANSLLDKSSRINDLPIISYTDAESLVREIINEKRIELINRSDVTISENISSTTTMLYLDPVELKRIISNLVNNSLQASSLKISINTSASNNKFTINISDDGIGIPQNILAKLGKSEITNKRAGNGLGLMHAFEMISLWNGHIEITSQENKGTSITITLPTILQEKALTVLIDNDELVRLTWERIAQKKDIPFIAISDPAGLEKITPPPQPETVFYIDSELDNDQRGENVAKDLFEKGYKNLFLTTGHSSVLYKENKILKGVINKNPPWN